MAMVFKLAKEAEKGWRRLKGFALLKKVVAGVNFKDGELVNEKQRVALKNERMLSQPIHNR